MTLRHEAMPRRGEYAAFLENDERFKNSEFHPRLTVPARRDVGVNSCDLSGTGALDLDAEPNLGSPHQKRLRSDVTVAGVVDTI